MDSGAPYCMKLGHACWRSSAIIKKLKRCMNLAYRCKLSQLLSQHLNSARQAVPLDRLEQSYMYFQMRKRRKQMKAQKANKQNKPINNENMINSQSSGTHQPSATLPPPPPLNNSFMDVLAPAASQPLPLRKGAIVDRLQTPTASGNNVAPRGKPGPPGSKELLGYPMDVFTLLHCIAMIQHCCS